MGCCPDGVRMNWITGYPADITELMSKQESTQFVDKKKEKNLPSVQLYKNSTKGGIVARNKLGTVRSCMQKVIQTDDKG
jgi:hypothetical protein